ncbi:protein of unknown function [Bradyrhizobium sp. ORS 285]|nr:protein of unknown function [Bradyrhizobium sp. ORS 285]
MTRCESPDGHDAILALRAVFNEETVELTVHRRCQLSSLRTQGPIPRNFSVRHNCQSSSHERPGVMGPCVRRDDGGILGFIHPYKQFSEKLGHFCLLGPNGRPGRIGEGHFDNESSKYVNSEPLERAGASRKCMAHGRIRHVEDTFAG